MRRPRHPGIDVVVAPLVSRYSAPMNTISAPLAVPRRVPPPPIAPAPARTVSISTSRSHEHTHYPLTAPCRRKILPTTASCVSDPGKTLPGRRGASALSRACNQRVPRRQVASQSAASAFGFGRRDGRCRARTPGRRRLQRANGATAPSRVRPSTSSAFRPRRRPAILTTNPNAAGGIQARGRSPFPPAHDRCGGNAGTDGFTAGPPFPNLVRTRKPEQAQRGRNSRGLRAPLTRPRMPTCFRHRPSPAGRHVFVWRSTGPAPAPSSSTRARAARCGSLAQTIPAPDPATTAQFGVSIAVEARPRSAPNIGLQGPAVLWAFERIAGTWTQKQRIDPQNGADQLSERRPAMARRTPSPREIVPSPLRTCSNPFRPRGSPRLFNRSTRTPWAHERSLGSSMSVGPSTTCWSARDDRPAPGYWFSVRLRL